MALGHERVMRDALKVSGEVPIYVVDGLGYTENAHVVVGSDGLRSGLTGGFYGVFLPWPRQSFPTPLAMRGRGGPAGPFKCRSLPTLLPTNRP